MFPIRDENPTLHTSFVTFLIVALNAASWIFLQGLGSNPALVKSICTLGLIPSEILGTVSPGASVSVGGGYVCTLDGVPNWITLITSMFMHGGWFHLIINMWFLLVFGDNVEDAMGPLKFLLFYLLCGIGAEVLQIATNPSSSIPMVGASGAIGGVMGAYAIMYPRAPVHLLVFFGFYITRIVVPASLMLGYWFLLQILGGLPALGKEAGGVAFWAHIGGFLTGIVLVKLMCDPKRLDNCRHKRGKTNKIVRKYHTFRDSL
ncbi:MAG: rhomboid family intramembrane serine protease [Endomicrobiales bacterium]|nr:rhomboid family intramembrane serine protease [Endomicrobiales bacterium]